MKQLLKCIFLGCLFMVIFVSFGLFSVFIEDFKIKESFKALKNIYQNKTENYELNFITDPKILCNFDKKTLIIYVLSAPNNFQNRIAIRNTWSNDSNIRVVYLLGTTLNETLNKQIENESLEFKDILQGDFIDNYQNLTIKTLMGLNWSANYCFNKSYFIAKIDDDVIVNTKQLISYLKNLIETKANIYNKFFCYYHVNAVVRRDNTNKFYVPFEELNNYYYNTYCDGPAYIYTNEMAPSLKNASNLIKIFRFEDVFMGMLATKLKTEFVSIQSKYSIENEIDTLVNSKQIGNKFFFYPCKVTNFQQIWKKINI